MKQFLFVITGMLLIFVSSCKKQQVVETPFADQNPVFYFRGIVDTASVNLTAGVNEYYMYSAYSQDTSGMYIFYGALKQVNCISKCDAVVFNINDNRRSSIGGSSNIDSLFPGNYKYLSDSSVTANYIEFKSELMPNMKPASFFWDFGDGSTSTLENPTHSYLVPNNYTVCHTISYTNGCANTICNVVKAESLSDCMAFIEATTNDTIINFNAISNGNSPTFYWNFGDTASVNNTSSLKSPLHVFSSPGIYKVRLDVVTADNCTTQVFKNIITSKYTIGCFANFTYSKLFIPVPSRFSTVTISFRDKNDNAYWSNLTAQPADSFFEILSVEDYEPNENNAQTKKIHARFKCSLSDGSKIISITNADAIIAVAHP